MIWQEFRKLCKQSMFWMCTIFLLFGNLFFLYLSQKNTTEYQNVYEQRENYKRFLDGDLDADVNGVYQADFGHQIQYRDSYQAFLEEMRNRSETMKAASIFSGKDSYSYRNIEKTCKDFKHLSGTTVQVDNCYGVRAFSTYDMGIVFVLVFLMLLVWYLFYYERNRGILLLIKGTKQGHFPLVVGKLGVLAIGAAGYTVLQESMTVWIFGYLYGYGNLNRCVQSISEYRNCPYALTVGKMLLAQGVIRVAIAEILAVSFYLISIVVRNELSAVVTVFAVCGILFGVSQYFSINGSMNVVKTVNPFFCWNPQHCLGTYQNLNLFGYPCGKNRCAQVAAVCVVLICVIIGIMYFCHSCQTAAESRLERLTLFLRRKTGFLWRHVSLLRFEWSKVVIQQKKWILFFFVLLWSISEVQQLQQPQYYATSGEALYHSYMKELSGKVTKKSLSYVTKKEAEVEALEQKVLKLADNAEKNEFLLLQYQSELEGKEEAAELLSNQLNKLKEKPGKLYEKYWVDERAYRAIWENSKKEIAVTALGCLILIFAVSGIYPFDEKKKILPLLHATRGGKRRQNRMKNLCAMGAFLLCVVMVLGPELGWYAKIDGFRVQGQRMCDFTEYFFESSITFGVYLILIFLSKMFFFVLTTVGMVWLSRSTRNELIANVIGCGLVVAIIVLCIGMRWDLALGWMHLF